MFLKPFLITVAVLFFALSSFSQPYTHVYYMDASFASVEKSKAFFVCKGYAHEGRFKLDCFVEKNGVLVIAANFTDSSIAVPDGTYQQYYAENMIQSQGQYLNNLKQGVWEDWNEDGYKTDSAFHDKGTILRSARYSYLYNYNKLYNGIYAYKFKDSIANNIYTNYYSDSGTLAGEMKIMVDMEIWTSYSKDGVSSDTIPANVEVQAEFPGGEMAWTRFLEKSLLSFNPADHGAGNGRWQVMVRFMVDKYGAISNIQAETNFGYKMEQTVVQMLKNGPKWKPAIHQGKAVRAFRRQPVTFMVEGL